MLGYYWIAVTADKYELPLIVAETARELALTLNIDIGSVVSGCARKRSGRNIGYKIVKVKRSK